MSTTRSHPTALVLKDIYARLEALGRLEKVQLLYHPLHHERGDFRFPQVISKAINDTDRILMIGAGVHGNEIAGPVTLACYGEEIITYARAKGLKVVLYPLRNPSAYGIPGKRYNIDSQDDDVQVGNNDFIRYELPDGSIVDDLRESDVYAAWDWASEPRFQVKLPAETRLMHELLRRDPLDQVVAVIDLHQDWITQDAPALAYHYAFGDLAVYAPIIREIEKTVPIARRRYFGAGYRGITTEGRVTRDAPEQAMLCDENGFIVRHDGTWTDLMYRVAQAQGRRIHCVTVETTGATPLDAACRVNLTWIKGIIDLVGEVSASHLP